MHWIWLRTDLRLHDNTALAAASQRGPIAAVYLITPQQWLAHDDAPCKVDFWLRNLQDLSKTLGARNIPLLIRTAATWDQAPDVLSKLCRELSVESVHVNEEYGIHESRRDAAVSKALEADGVTFHQLPGPIAVRTRQRADQDRHLFPGVQPVPQGLLQPFAQRPAPPGSHTQSPGAIEAEKRPNP